MADNEHNFSIEDVDDSVWQNVYKAAVPKKRSFSKRIGVALENWFNRFGIGRDGYTGKRRYSKVRLAYAFVLMAFVIVSCTYKVKSYSTYGDVVSFALAKERYLLNNDYQSKILFSSFSHIVSPSDADSLLFFGCIQKNNKEAKKIIGNLKVTNGVSNVVITPVVFEFKESLFSSLLSDAFDIQISKATPDNRQLKSKVKAILKEKGVGSVDVQVDGNSQDIVFSAKTVEQEKLPQRIEESVVIPNELSDMVKAADRKDTPKPKGGMKVEKPNLNSSGWKQDLALMTELTKALEKDELVDNRKPHNLEVKDGELYINGEKQSKEVSDKYRKYFKNDNYTITNDEDQPKSTSNHSESFNFDDKPKKASTYPGTDIPRFDPVQYKKELKLMNLLIDGLHKEGLIDRKKPYLVNIKEGELYIDNKKQPKEVSDKFRQYFSGNNYGFQKG